MNIDLHILTWNESDIIRLVLRHYKKFCRTMYVYDNHSTDNTREIAIEEGATVKLFGSAFFDDENNRQLKNNCWKGSDADFVIVCDCDEILCQYRPSKCNLNVDQPFDLNTEFTIYPTTGWQVMSDSMPKYSLLELTEGYVFHNYSKTIIFSPKKITEINYGPGAHESDAKGSVVWANEPLYVLHYKHIGGVQRTIDRYKILQKRLSKKNRQMGWGIHYNRTPASLRQEWSERMLKSKPLI